MFLLLNLKVREPIVIKIVAVLELLFKRSNKIYFQKNNKDYCFVLLKVVDLQSFIFTFY